MCGIAYLGQQIMDAIHCTCLGVFLEANDERRGFQCLRCQMAVRVDLKRDNRIRPRDFPRAGHQVAFALIIAVGDHRAMHELHQ